MSLDNGKDICVKCNGTGKCPTCRKSKRVKCRNCDGTGEIDMHIVWEGPLT